MTGTSASPPARSPVLLDERSGVRAAIRRFLFTGLVVLLLVAVPVIFWVQAVSRDLATKEVMVLTQRLADYAVSPSLAHDLISGNPEALSEVEERLAPWVTDESILRIKIWGADGTILYSNAPGLTGRTFPLDQSALDMLAGGPGTISLGVPQEEENVFEADSGELVEVYVASRSSPETPLLFEVYFDDSVVRDPQRHILLGMIPVILLSMAVLQGAQLIPGIRLARQVQARQRERRAMLQAAIEAGERERVRLASTLHDDIIQDLAGLAYVLEPSSEPGPDPGTVLRQSIGKLRTVTSELYSTPVSVAELPAALGVLVERIRSQGIRALVKIQTPVPLDDIQADACHRIAREAVVNIIKHSQAKNVFVGLGAHGDKWQLLITEDGIGFDQQAPVPNSHFGLRLMSYVAESAGASLEITSVPGNGSRVAMEFDPVPPPREGL